MEFLYQALIIFLNRRCTIGCTACSAGATPLMGEELAPAWLDRFFQRLSQKPSLFSGYLTWTGGEPFLSFNSLRHGVGLASQVGYQSEILTGGLWFDSSPGLLEELNPAGSFGLRISLDAEHQRLISLETVIGLIGRATELEIEVNFTLREIPCKDEKNEKNSARQSMREIKRRLPDFYERNVSRSRWIHRIPHIPFGAETAGEPVKRTPCRMAFRDLVIGEDGLVYPCCGFFGLPGHGRLALGDPLKKDWESLVAGKENHRFRFPCEECVGEQGTVSTEQVNGK